jgi:hypothetical protein
MIFSRTHSFSLLLPWKTASQTLVARLLPYDQSPYPRFYYFNKHLNRVVHQHITLPDFRLLPESHEVSKIGVFIRNPYDRAYSGFRQLQTDLQQQPRQPYPCKWVKELVLKQLEENRRGIESANYDFDTWIANLTEDQVYESGRNSSFPLHPLHYWTHNAGELFVDFVGKVEAFEIDLEKLQELFGISISSKANSNVVDIQGDAKKSSHGYRYTNRMSKKSIDKINHIFNADFELFSYTQIN